MSSPDRESQDDSSIIGVDDPFALIEKGNDLEAISDDWVASRYFSRASIILKKQSETMRDEVGTCRNSVYDDLPQNDVKKLKIAALYQDQSFEYLHRARENLISAIQSEYEQDRKNYRELPPAVKQISKGFDSAAEVLKEASEAFYMNSETPDELQKRKVLFCELFVDPCPSVYTSIEEAEEGKNSKKKDGDIVETEIELPPVATIESMVPPPLPPNSQRDLSVQQEELTLSLEERLANLNSSLPPTIIDPKSKTDEKRMEDIHAGLVDLGVYAAAPPSYNDAAKLLLNGGNNISEEEQVEEIMSMAKDEVMLDEKEGGKEEHVEEGGTRLEDDNDVMEILNRASIRIDMPIEASGNFDDNLEKDYKMLKKNIKMMNINIDSDEEDEASYAQDKDTTFCKNVASEENDEADRQVDEGRHSNRKVMEMEECLKKVQQLLLQAAVCIEEYDLLEGDKDAENGDDNENNNDIDGEKEAARGEEGNAEKMLNDDSHEDHVDIEHDGKEVEDSVQNQGTGVSHREEDAIHLEPESKTGDEVEQTEGEEEGKCAMVDVEGQVLNETSGQAVISATTPALKNDKQAPMMKVGEDGLKEAQQLLEKLLQLWPK